MCCSHGALGAEGGQQCARVLGVVGVLALEEGEVLEFGGGEGVAARELLVERGGAAGVGGARVTGQGAVEAVGEAAAVVGGVCLEGEPQVAVGALGVLDGAGDALGPLGFGVPAGGGVLVGGGAGGVNRAAAGG
ncbi:hypothetical protein DQ392_20020 [Streptomyces reniochalinae]|uniref:Uncharacterized protein n=1 Tax=Streptomyces reniochalinae TaxID=2250578 RepID=A0A367EER0_9ACTN|nr:hypothetical protein DQ392_20020 [Streptomyces reniochalinae]